MWRKEPPTAEERKEATPMLPGFDEEELVKCRECSL